MHGCIVGASMARAGRRSKRRLYPEPSERAPDDRIRTSRQPHRRELPEPLRLDERAESELGRLALRGVITDEQYDAGDLYARVAGAYRAVIDGPRATAGSGRGFDCEPEGCACLRKIDPDYSCRCEQLKLSHNAARRALKDAGRRAVIVVDAVVLFGQDARSWPILYLRSGLDALAKHFRIRPSRR